MAINPILKQKFEKIIEHLKGEMSLLRTGRATPALVENLLIEYMNQKFALKQLASISVIQPNIIVIEPWDKGSLDFISKAIVSSSLGMAPIAEKDTIRLALPALTEERRKQLIKLLHEKLEESRVSLRREREDAWRDIQRDEKEKSISEDAKFKAKNELQKLIDDYNQKVKDLGDQKEREILTL